MNTSQSERKYARNKMVKQLPLFPCALQADVSNPGKLMFFVCRFFPLFCPFFITFFFFFLAPCLLSQPIRSTLDLIHYIVPGMYLYAYRVLLPLLLQQLLLAAHVRHRVPDGKIVDMVH